MSTHISIHDVNTLHASTVQDQDGCSPHITFNFEGEEFAGRASVTVYLPNAELNARLIALINEAAQ